MREFHLRSTLLKTTLSFPFSPRPGIPGTHCYSCVPGTLATPGTLGTPCPMFTWYNRYTTIEKEELLYPSSTMVAEVGGTLGLFLGVSFMTIWDGALWIKGHVVLSNPIELRHP